MVVWTILVQYSFRQYRGHSLVLIFGPSGKCNDALVWCPLPDLWNSHEGGTEKMRSRPRVRRNGAFMWQGCPLEILSWGAANGGLRDGGLSKSEDIWGKRPFSSVFWISQVLFGPSGKGRKRRGRKRAKKADFGWFPGRAARHPLNPHLLHRHLRQPNWGHSRTFKKFRAFYQNGLGVHKIFVRKIWFTPPPPEKGPKMRKHCTNQ